MRKLLSHFADKETEVYRGYSWPVMEPIQICLTPNLWYFHSVLSFLPASGGRRNWGDGIPSQDDMVKKKLGSRSNLQRTSGKLAWQMAQLLLNWRKTCREMYLHFIYLRLSGLRVGQKREQHGLGEEPPKEEPPRSVWVEPVGWDSTPAPPMHETELL